VIFDGARAVSPRVLVAGIGNIFFGDDGFGVELARRLAREELPEGVVVIDVGIRALHLAFALLERPGLLLVVDAVSRGGPPGTIYVIQPTAGGEPAQVPDAHAMNLETVIATVRSLGGHPPPIVLVGCEPAYIGERRGLSKVVERALPRATELVRQAIADALGKRAAVKPTSSAPP
jgi:hydrogenase maturation protease